MKLVFEEPEMKVARSALMAGEEQESILRIYTILQQKLRRSKLNIGLYPTPLSLARFMVEIAQPEPGEVIYDPACGSGAFFIEAHRYVKAHYGAVSNTFLGYDFNSYLLAICKEWMKANGIDISHIRERRFFMRDTPDPGLWGSEGESYDDSDNFKGKYVILVHPPYEKVKTQQKASDNEVTNKPVEHYDRSFLQHCMDILQKHSKGRCGIVVSQDFFYNPAARDLRRSLVNTFNIRLIVRLPEMLFATVKRPVKYHSYLLYFDKQDTTSTILRCNIREDEVPVPSRSRQSSDGASFEEAENIWKQWKEESSLPDEVQKYAWILDAKTVAERDKDYRLLDAIPSREEEASIPLDELMQRLVEQTGEIHELAQQLQKRIKEGI